MSPKPVLFFDGVCNLCNGAVQFIIRHDREAKIHFASLQSTLGKEACNAVLAAKGKVPDSLIFLDEGTYYTESEAALRVAAYLDGGWKTLRHLRVFPKILRDAVYALMAKSRYRLFGKRRACMLPTPELKSRFLES